MLFTNPRVRALSEAIDAGEVILPDPDPPLPPVQGGGAWTSLDGIICSTPWLADRYGSLNPRTYVCRNGIDLKRYALTPPEREEFARETVSKIRQWRFHPYRDAGGQPKEVAHELTVNFRLVRKGPGAR